jgi:glycosyltransferase involved in cell wall biosynthesis
MPRWPATSCAGCSPADALPGPVRHPSRPPHDRQEAIPLPPVPRVDQLTDFARHRVLRALGAGSAPGRLGREALRRAGGGRGRRTAEYAHLLRQLELGRQVPLEELGPALTRQLDAADAALARGRRRAAAALVDRALRLAFHPSVHYGPLGSPLMLRTERFLDPLRASPAARSLLFEADPPPRRAAAPAPREDPHDRPLRVLVLCASSWTFIDRVATDLEEHTDLELRTADLSSLPLAERPTHALAVRMREAWSRDHRLRPVPAALEEDLRWADTVIVEWGDYPFAWLSFLDLGPYRVRTVARIHRFEILTPYPLLARSAAYDEIAFVAPTVRAFLTAVSPRLAQAGALRDVQNVHDLERFTRAGDQQERQERNRFELLQIGWATPIKGVEFSLDLLAQLREHDERYTLSLVGPTLEQSASPRTAAWARQVQSRLDELGDGVRVLGFRSDIPELLAHAGFLLSSSSAEGTHESVAEAAAAGCVPIVRNWPEMAPWGGAGMIFPADWIVDEVEQASGVIRSLTGDEAHTEEARRRRRWVLAHRDPASIRADYLALLRG